MQSGDLERRTTSVHWPVAVDEHLDRLRAQAIAAGERVSRSELLAALVCHATDDGEGLGVVVRAYRRMEPSTLGAGIDDAEGVARLGRPRGIDAT